jgi:predicted permease
MAVRLAIGASRRRLMSQLMMETAVLFAAAGLLAGLLALWLNDLVAKLQFMLPIPIAINLAPDGRIAAFVIFLIVLAGATAGLLPAIHAAFVPPATAMKEEGDWAFSRVRLRNGFVVTQIAVSLLLLVIGGLFMRSLSFAGRVDLGLDPRNLEALSLNWFIAGYGEDDMPGRQSLEAFEKTLLLRAGSLPNVEALSIATDIPMDGSGNGFNVVTIPGLQASDRRNGVRNADWNLVSPGYFKTMRIPLLRGRDFTDAEHGGVAIINETMARQYWPGQDPVGQRFFDGEAKDGRSMEVIGVAKDTNTRYVGLPAEPLLYAPLGQYSYPQHYLMVRTTRGSVEPQLRQILLELNPNLPILGVQSMDELISVGLMPQRIGAWAGTGMGLVGLVLASLGIYGVTAYSVTRRTREIGVRTALGATSSDILRIVFQDGLTIAGIGILIGLGAAWAATRFISSFLFGIGPSDAVSFIVMAVLLAVVTLVATYIPARRAAKIDPMAALRHQ